MALFTVWLSTAANLSRKWFKAIMFNSGRPCLFVETVLVGNPIGASWAIPFGMGNPNKGWRRPAGRGGVGWNAGVRRDESSREPKGIWLHLTNRYRGCSVPQLSSITFFDFPLFMRVWKCSRGSQPALGGCQCQEKNAPASRLQRCDVCIYARL